MKKILLLCTVIIFSNEYLSAQTSGYHLTDSFHIKSNGWWDYIAVNKNKLYVSHGTQVNILDEQNGDSLALSLVQKVFTELQL